MFSYKHLIFFPPLILPIHMISEYKMDFIPNNEIKSSRISYYASKILQFFFSVSEKLSM